MLLERLWPNGNEDGDMDEGDASDVEEKGSYSHE